MTHHMRACQAAAIRTAPAAIAKRPLWRGVLATRGYTRVECRRHLLSRSPKPTATPSRWHFASHERAWLRGYPKRGRILSARAREGDASARTMEGRRSASSKSKRFEVDSVVVLRTVASDGEPSCTTARLPLAMLLSPLTTMMFLTTVANGGALRVAMVFFANSLCVCQASMPAELGELGVRSTTVMRKSKSCMSPRPPSLLRRG